MNKLLAYLPPYLQAYRELIDITDAKAPELDLFRQAYDVVMNNQFVESLDEYGCSRWEKMLKIIIKGDETLDIRRFQILNKLLSDLPYTMRQLHSVLTRLCGANYYSVDLRHKSYEITIWIEIQQMDKQQIVIDTINHMIPANLMLDVRINFRTHGWLNENKLTHGALSSYTHEQIKSIIL